jgi:hypothetical protein
MRQPREVWFAPTPIRGFGVVHWKGPAFIFGLALIVLPAALFSLANQDRYPLLSAAGAVLTMGAIIVGYYVCSIHTADRDTEYDEDGLLHEAHWRVLPRWVKAASLGIGLPAWIVLATGVVSGQWDTPLQHAAFATFISVAVLQTTFLFRSYWRMEL